MMTRRGLWLAVAVVVLAAAGAAAWLWYPRAVTSPAGTDLGALPRGVAPDDLNVLFVTLDTTRADRLGCYGAPERVTPNIDRLAEEGVLFDRAFTAVPLTLPAHSTIFTGMLPPTHGVRDNGGYILEAKADTLAEMLKRRGFSTGAFVGAYVLDSKWGLDQGFDRYFDQFNLSKYKTLSLGDVARVGSEVVDAAIPWLDEHAGGRFFAWLHFYDPHSPYEAPEPYRSQFRDRPYLGEIAYTDFQLGRVLQWLGARGLADKTVVVVMGDHGESLNEHGEGTHGLFIYDATVRIPVVIRAPFANTRGRRVPSVVRSEDLVPTVLDLLGMAAPKQVQGTSVTALMTGATRDLNLEAYSESLYARNHYGWSELRALRSGRYKFIDAPKRELYDMDRDPGELANIVLERRSLADQMEAALARLNAAVAQGAAAAAPSAVDPETRERLAALGYIGTFVNVHARPGERLPDPKDKIDIFNLMMQAQERTGKEAVEAAIQRLTRVVEQDPNILDAWIMLGNEYARLRNYQAALRHFRRAAALNPDYDLAIINIANSYRALGDYRAAIVGYERYLERDPRNAYIRYQLGELLVDTGDLARAEQAFREALDDDQRVASARTALGVIAIKRGDLERAEREIRAALQQNAEARLAHFNLALIAEERRDYAAAVREYEKEIELHPNSYKAAFNLGKLYEQLGDPARQEQAYRKAVEANANFAEGYFFLAKLFLDRGTNFDEAVALCRKGLEVGPTSEFAPLGHYVIADIYSRMGRVEDAEREAAAGRRLETARRRAAGRDRRGG